MSKPDEIMRLHKELVESNLHFFPPKGKKVKVSNEQGVYIIYDQDSVVLHVGRTVSGKDGLNQRLQDHLGNQSSFSKKYLQPKNVDLRDGYKFKYLTIENGRARVLVEALTAGLLCPAHIGTGEKNLIN